MTNSVCSYTKIVALKDLRPHPKNRNKHSDEQIERLSQLLKYQGVRHPIVVSKLSGFIVAGHGRLAAAEKLGLTQYPCDFQDFENEDQEYAFLQSDNAIAAWAELDLAGINSDLGDLGPDFDIDMLGLRNFSLNAPLTDPTKEWEGMPEFSHEDQTSAYKIIVHFATKTHLEEFGRLLGQGVTENTRSIWHPKAEIGTIADKRYVATEDES